MQPYVRMKNGWQKEMKLRENNTRFNEKKDNQFYYVIKHSQVECTQKALIFIYGPGKRTEG